jgi:hypothetical protein
MVQQLERREQDAANAEGEEAQRETAGHGAEHDPGVAGRAWLLPAASAYAVTSGAGG